MADIQNRVFHFKEVQGTWNFQMKADMGRHKNGALEFPCRCRFLISDAKTNTFSKFIDLLETTSEAHIVTISKHSLWEDEEWMNCTTDHVFCNEDPDQEERIGEIFLQGRAIRNQKSGKSTKKPTITKYRTWTLFRALCSLYK